MAVGGSLFTENTNFIQGNTRILLGVLRYSGTPYPYSCIRTRTGGTATRVSPGLIRRLNR